MVLTKNEKIEVLLLYGENRRQPVQTAQAFRAANPNGPRVTATTVRRILASFHESGSVVAQRPRPGRPRTARTPEMRVDVLAKINAEPHSSTRQVAREAGISRRSLGRILKQEKFHPYKMEFHQALTEDDPDRRMEFCEWVQDKLLVDPQLAQHIMFSDEALFMLSGDVNRQNYRYWSDTNPHWMRGNRVQNSPRVMVWCGMWGERIIGPYFFDAAVTGNSYVDLLQSLVWPVLEDAPLQLRRHFYFQQDGASAHYSLQARRWLDSHLPGRWIGRRGPIEWPPRSPDLTPPDFFLWGYVKSVVFQTPPANLDILKQRITECIANIPANTLQRVQEAWKNRIQHCLWVNGQHFEHTR